MEKNQNRGKVAIESIASKLKKAEIEISDKYIEEDIKSGEKLLPKKEKKIKLYVRGKLDRQKDKFKDKFKDKLFAFNQVLEKEIDRLCSGSSVGVLNALLLIGLRAVKNSEEAIDIDFPKDIEDEIENLNSTSEMLPL
jgi:predicted DNA-binding protein YlxM (UPF0122 family)